MRAFFGWSAILAATLLATTGCRSGAGSSGWSWNRKNNSGVNNIASPALPSSNATPSTSPGHPANMAQSPAGSLAGTGAAGGAYPTTPASATYPGSYPSANVPGANMTADATAPAGGYPTTPGTPYTPPATGATPGGLPAGGVAAQTGPYNENYGQVPGTAVAAATPAAAPVGAPATDAYAANPAAAYAANPATTPAAPGGAYAPTENYRTSAQPAADSYTAVPDTGAASRYGNPAAMAPPTDAGAADRYAAQNVAAGDPGTGAAAGGTGYQPGASNWQPGNTGYNPPGVPPYQVPAQSNVASAPSRGPYYRPGGTSDYLPSGSVPSTASVPTDRYGTGAAGSDPAAGAGSYR